MLHLIQLCWKPLEIVTQNRGEDNFKMTLAYSTSQLAGRMVTLCLASAIGAYACRVLKIGQGYALSFFKASIISGSTLLVMAVYLAYQTSQADQIREENSALLKINSKEAQGDINHIRNKIVKHLNTGLFSPFIVSAACVLGAFAAYLFKRINTQASMRAHAPQVLNACLISAAAAAIPTLYVATSFQGFRAYRKNHEPANGGQNDTSAGFPSPP